MKQIKKQITAMLILLISISLASALTVNELIDSTNFDYSKVDINVTGFSDAINDTDSNGQNDRLTITLNVYVNISGAYNVFVDLEESYGVITNNNSKSFSTGANTITVSFSTKLFNQHNHTYNIRIYNNVSSLVYRKDGKNTSTYTNYEKGTNITQITDENVNNNLIRINLTLNITDSQTANITAFLRYNDSYISASKQETLSQGIQTISVDFDNETIKSTHYNNNFTLDLVTIGNKTIDTNHSTAVYNYEDFAKTSYIKNFTSGTIDTNANDLSEFLEINVTVNIKSNDDYELKGEIYDLFDNYIINFSETESLTTGINKIQLRINGSDIYASYTDGPYIVNYITLLDSSADTIDYLYQPYTTNISYYSDYEQPPLPDLYITMDENFDSSTNITNITLNVSNIGTAPAFSVFTDLFDNNSYSNNRTESYLNVSASLIYNFTINNTLNDTAYTAIVDLGNYVDEINESNNIADNEEAEVSSISLLSISSIYSIDNLHIFQFTILNNGTTALTNINWTIDFGDGNTAESIYPFNLTSNEDIFVFVEYEYADNESHTVTANVSVSNLSSSKSISVGGVSDLQITSFSELYSFGTEKIWEFIIKNAGETNATNIYWNITGTDSPISSVYPINLTVNESIIVIVGENLTNYQQYTITAKAFTDTTSTTETLSARGKELEVSNIKTLYTNGLIKILEFLVTNTYTSTINNINWSLYTGEETINAIYPFNLSASENIKVIIENNYTSSGNKAINFSVISAEYNDWESKNITV